MIVKKLLKKITFQDYFLSRTKDFFFFFNIFDNLHGTRLYENHLCKSLFCDTFLPQKKKKKRKMYI